VQNGVLRGIFGSKWVDVTGEWRKLQIKELIDVLTLPNLFERINQEELVG
jgi:hypothetical protein